MILFEVISYTIAIMCISLILVKSLAQIAWKIFYVFHRCSMEEYEKCGLATFNNKTEFMFDIWFAICMILNFIFLKI